MLDAFVLLTVPRLSLTIRFNIPSSKVLLIRFKPPLSAPELSPLLVGVTGSPMSEMDAPPTADVMAVALLNDPLTNDYNNKNYAPHENVNS